MHIELLNNSTEPKVLHLGDMLHITIRLHQPGTVTLCAVENNNLVGFIQLYKMEKVTYLYAAPGAIQEEIFRELLTAAETIGFSRIVLHVSFSSIPFFKKLGYLVSSENTMVKILPLSASFKNYEKAREFIEKLPHRVYSLDHFKECMVSFFDFQKALTCIHVGGTNGKGSTINYIKEVLKTSGYTVGMFTSPALINRLEIIKSDDHSIDEKIFIKIINRYMNVFLYYHLSMFEIEVFVSVVYFLYKATDIVLYEVGLGGLLDATNIIMPILAVNTNIGLDHTDYLGSSYKEIAFNKAGIVKEGIDYMTGEIREDCLEVFRDTCQKYHSHLICINKAYNIKGYTPIVYDYHHYHIELNTNAFYQINNSLLAINVLEYIRDRFPFDNDDLERGFKQAEWAGRFECIYNNPVIIIDGAHNKEGMNAFYETAKNYVGFGIIYSALKDKDTHEMIKTLLKLTDDVTVCTFDHPRAASYDQLAEDFPVKKEDWKTAVDNAIKYKKNMFITGSLYFISLVRAYILHNY